MIGVSTANAPTRGLRIAIDGAQSTGKTTLLNFLAHAFPDDFRIIPEIVRIVGSEFGLHTEHDWVAIKKDPERLAALFRRHATVLAAVEDDSPSFILDSSFHLHESYRRYFNLPEIFPDYRDRYDLIFFCPSDEIPYMDDGFRFPEGRAEVERIYLDLIGTRHSGTFIRLPGGDLRFSAAQKIVRELLQAPAQRVDLD